MDDVLIHYIATGGSGLATLGCVVCLWLLTRLQSDITSLRDEIVTTGKEVAELRGIVNTLERRRGH